MDAFDFRSKQVDRVLNVSDLVGDITVLKELLSSLSNSELENFADHLEEYVDELIEIGVKHDRK